MPIAAQTASFVSEITVFNPNGAAINVAVSYYDANNLATAGPKSCAAVNVPANRSVQFALAGQCTLEPGSHFDFATASATSKPRSGIATESDPTASHASGTINQNRQRRSFPPSRMLSRLRLETIDPRRGMIGLEFDHRSHNWNERKWLFDERDAQS